MKRILCYGDSNTYGLIAGRDARFEKNERWSGILSEILKDKFEVIEDGLNNRSLFVKIPDGIEYCGVDDLPIKLTKYNSLDAIIIALGTNDVQFTFDYNAELLQAGLQKLINIIRNNDNLTKIIIVPPIKIDYHAAEGYFKTQFDNISIERTNETFYLYKEIATKNNCEYFDFNEIAKPVDIDGLHFSKTSHQLIAEKLSEFLIKLLLN